jgi:hypothetical protein
MTGFCDYADEFSGPIRVNVMIDWNRVIGDTFVQGSDSWNHRLSKA